VRGAEPAAFPVDSPVERVDAETADEWSEFMQRASILDTGPWLPLLVGRPGWHHYVARGDDGAVVAARSMFIGGDGLAWLGMDAPVPGIRTGDFCPAAALCEFIVADGVDRVVPFFLADIEAPSPEQDTPACEYFGRLGFSRPYVRAHWARS